MNMTCSPPGFRVTVSPGPMGSASIWVMRATPEASTVNSCSMTDLAKPALAESSVSPSVPRFTISR